MGTFLIYKSGNFEAVEDLFELENWWYGTDWVIRDLCKSNSIKLNTVEFAYTEEEYFDAVHLKVTCPELLAFVNIDDQQIKRLTQACFIQITGRTDERYNPTERSRVRDLLREQTKGYTLNEVSGEIQRRAKPVPPKKYMIEWSVSGETEVWAKSEKEAIAKVRDGNVINVDSRFNTTILTGHTANIR